MIKEIKKNRGITLIALVITIIVLLILAGVSISMLSGENGILRQATRAKEETEDAAVREQIHLAEISARTANDGALTKDGFVAELNKSFGEGKYTIEDVTNEDGSKGWKVTVGRVEETIMGDGETVWTQTSDGKITNGKGITLEIGDKITYDPHSGDGASLTYPSPKDSNGYDEQEFSTESATTDWGVLGVENGQIMIMPMKNIAPDGASYYYLGASSSSDTESGKTAYKNAVSEIDSISKVYGHGEGATGARAITVEDINKITGYNPKNTGKKDPDQTGTGIPYGQNELYQYGNKVKYYWDGTTKPYYESDVSQYTGKNLSDSHSSKGFIWFNGSDWQTSQYPGTDASTTNKQYITELTSDYYYYYPETLTKDSNSSASVGISATSNKKAYNMIFGNTSSQYYWLGSADVSTGSGGAGFGVRIVFSGSVESGTLVNSNGYASSSNGGVRPVVYLDSKVELEGDATSGYTIK